MKWAVFFALLVFAVGLGLFARGKGRVQARIASLVPLLLIWRMDISPIWIEGLRTDARGISLSLADAGVIALLVALPKGGYPAPFRAVRTLYFLICLASGVFAWMVDIWTFGVYQLLVSYLYADVAARLMARDDLLRALLNGFAIALIFEAGYGFYQRYVLHVHQIPGHLGHQNTLGMMINLMLPMLLADYLSHLGQRRQRLILTGLVAGVCLLILTLSRGSLGMAVVGLGAVYLASLYRNFSRRKIAFAFGGLVILLAILAKSYETIFKRFARGRSTAEDGRDRYEAAARMMIEDNPFGVGLSQFSPNMADYAPLAGIEGYSETVIVHNVFLLTRAELGLIGLIVFLLMYGHPLLVGLKTGLSRKPGPMGDLALAGAIAIGGLLLHSNLEWAARQPVLMNQFWLVAGSIAGLRRRIVRPVAATAYVAQSGARVRRHA